MRSRLYEFWTKEELYQTMEEFAYVTYNHVRPHSYNGYRTPYQARTTAAAEAGYLIGLPDHSASGMGVFVNGMAAQRWKAPLIKTDSSDRLPRQQSKEFLATSVTKKLDHYNLWQEGFSLRHLLRQSCSSS